VKVTVFEAVRPPLSVTLKTTERWPLLGNVRVKIDKVDKVDPVVVAHLYETMVPSGSEDPLPSNVQLFPATQVTTGAARGGWFVGVPPTEYVIVFALVSPPTSTAVSVSVIVQPVVGVAQVRVVVTPVFVGRPAAVHVNERFPSPPSSVDDEASSAHTPVVLLHDTVKFATGGWFVGGGPTVGITQLESTPRVRSKLRVASVSLSTRNAMAPTPHKSLKLQVATPDVLVVALTGLSVQ
jgi:hypothetical protein